MPISDKNSNNSDSNDTSKAIKTTKSGKKKTEATKIAKDKVVKSKTVKKASTKKASTAKKSTAKKTAAKKTAAKKSTTNSSKNKNLVIVESPAKAKTLNKILGSKFIVKSSVGHIRDLPKSKLGIDIEADFEPSYIVMRDKSKVVKELRDAAKNSETVYLAPDKDREGEAIAWHLLEALKIKEDMTKRVIFNEITERAIKDAFANPTSIDHDKVSAQQARRILDRLVGYKLSPLLWKKVKRGLSAGRVQSVAARLVSDREKLIKAFKSHTYWMLKSEVEKNEAESQDNFPFSLDFKAYNMTPRERYERRIKTDAEGFKKELAEKAETKNIKIDFEDKNLDLIEVAQKLNNSNALDKKNDIALEPKHDLRDKEFVDKIIAESKDADWLVKDVKVQKKTEQPRAPFITSTLQRAASTELHFSAKYTMSLAQTLYEGIDVGKDHVGLITYMRTDSVRIASEAIAEVRDYISQNFNTDYLPAKPRFFKGKTKGEQDAHECIRPTSVLKTPEQIEQYLKKDKKHKDAFRLYSLIWRQFVCCQMAPMSYNLTTIAVAAGKGTWKCYGRELLFDGWTKLSKYSSFDSNSEEVQRIPLVKVGEKLNLLKLDALEKQTLPPARYTEASLVKTLESEGIGRPSTYAAILSNIQDRGYVDLIERKFHATELGMLVSDLLIEHFPREMSADFTSNLELQLDSIEEGKLPRVDIIRNFWTKFAEDLEKAEKEMKSVRGENAVQTDSKCPKCGAPMVERWSKRGKFLGCSKYPDCDGILQINGDGITKVNEPSEYTCELCNSPMVYKMSRFGKRFLACSNYPECKNTKPVTKDGKAIELPKVDVTCDLCGKPMAVKRGKRGVFFLGCSNYPKCKNTMQLDKNNQVVPKKPKNTTKSKAKK